MTQPDTWYVAFGPDQAAVADSAAAASRAADAAAAARSMRTFKSEIDAKLFTLRILAKGWSARAGTLTPPARVVEGPAIEHWAKPGR